MTRDEKTSDTIQDTKQLSLTSLDGVQDQDSIVNQTVSTTDKQMSTKDTNETQPNQENQNTSDILTTRTAKTITNSEKTDDERKTEKRTKMTDNSDITVDDYLTDEYFRPIYECMTQDKLTGNNGIDRKIIIMSENYYLKGKLMYKVTPTRGRKEKRIALRHHSNGHTYVVSMLNQRQTSTSTMC